MGVPPPVSRSMEVTACGDGVVLERGGALRGPEGTTVRWASVYAVSAPVEVYVRRDGILLAPPLRKEATAAGELGSTSRGAGSCSLLGRPARTPIGVGLAAAEGAD